jgi:hypothetical protein
MNSNNNPSIDPANNDTLAGSIRFAFNKLLQQVNGMLPAQVIAYDRTTNRVQVQLLIAVVTTDGSRISRPQIASIPVLVLGGGGFMLSFPLNPGDLGWVLANDRDISLFLQDYNESPPNTARIKNFSDGLFIPDIMKGYTIDPEDEAHAVLSSVDGTIRIALWPDKVKITSPLTLVEGDLTVTGALNAEGGLSGSGGAGPNPFTLTGNLLVTGNIGATGTITPGV